MESNDSFDTIEHTHVLYESDVETTDGDFKKKVNTLEQKPTNDRVYILFYDKIFLMFCAHVGALIGIYLMFTSAKIHTTIFGKCLNEKKMLQNQYSIA